MVILGVNHLVLLYLLILLKEGEVMWFDTMGIVTVIFALGILCMELFGGDHFFRM